MLAAGGLEEEDCCGPGVREGDTETGALGGALGGVNGPGGAGRDQEGRLEKEDGKHLRFPTTE